MVNEIPGEMPGWSPRGGGGRGRSNWVAWALFAVLLASLFVNFMLLIALIFGAGGGSGSREVLVDGDAGAAEKVLVIPVHGLLVEAEGSPLGGDAVASMLQALERAEKDVAVKAIVLDVDSPGGGITDCDRIHHRLATLRRARPDVKLVVSMGDVAASGGYYVSAAADRIYAHRSTITGSIGVIIPRFSLEGLAEKIGVKADPIKSKEHKDAGSPFRALTPEERAQFQGMVNEMYEQFLQVVLEGRKGLTREKLEPLADGGVMTGQKAKEAGLVDEIGFLDDAIKAARELAHAPGAKVVRYERPPSLLERVLGAEAPAPPPEAAAAARLAGLLGGRTGRMLYLWMPGGD